MVGHVSYFLNPASLAADGRTDRNQAEGDRRDDDHLHRRPDLPVVPHDADDPAGLLPRVGDGRNRARRHQRVRPQVRPAAVDARVRLAAHPGPRCRSRSRTRTRCTSGGSARRRPPTTTTASSRATSSSLMDGLQLAGPEPHARDVPRRPLPRAAADSRARTRLGTIATLRRPRLLAGHRLRRPRQRRHPLLGPEGGRPRRDRQRRRPACTGSSTAAGATSPSQWPTTPVKLFDPAGHRHDVPGRRRSRPSSQPTAGTRPGRRAGGQEVTRVTSGSGSLGGPSPNRPPT